MFKAARSPVAGVDPSKDVEGLETAEVAPLPELSVTGLSVWVACELTVGGEIPGRVANPICLLSASKTA